MNNLMYGLSEITSMRDELVARGANPDSSGGTNSNSDSNSNLSKVADELTYASYNLQILVDIIKDLI